jgi:cyclase
MKTFPTYYLCAFLLTLTITVSAQNPQQAPGKSINDVVMTAELVKPGLYLIAGGGGNTLLRFSPRGLILVNGKLPDNYRSLMSQVRKISKISDLPVRGLILTDHHAEHIGNNAKFLAAGVQIIAQENVKQRLSADHSSDVKSVLPTFTYARDFNLQLGGVEIQLMHFGNAHTNGDTVVYFPNLKVVAVGELFSPNTPNPDFSSGGSLVNWGSVLAQILKLDFDIVVPSTGSMVARADLETFKTKLDTLISRATGLVRQGVPKERLLAQLKTDDLGWQFSFTGDQLDRFYKELCLTK